jgi:glucose-6-phosphate isomerase
VFTPVGQLALALLTGSTEEFCKGARDIDALCNNGELSENPAADLAVVQYLLDIKFDVSVRVTMPYIYRLRSLARWDQQLIAESLGKTEHRNPIPTAALGTQDQHSLLQQWMDGPRKQWHVFIKSSEQHNLTVPKSDIPELDYLEGKSFSTLLKACYVGTSQALTQDNHASATITIPKLDAYHLGQLFYIAMVEVVLLGKLYRINPYGQPGVELGKTITKELLRN